MNALNEILKVLSLVVAGVAIFCLGRGFGLSEGRKQGAEAHQKVYSLIDLGKVFGKVELNEKNIGLINTLLADHIEETHK